MERLKEEGTPLSKIYRGRRRRTADLWDLPQVSQSANSCRSAIQLYPSRSSQL